MPCRSDTVISCRASCCGRLMSRRWSAPSGGACRSWTAGTGGARGRAPRARRARARAPPGRRGPWAGRGRGGPAGCVCRAAWVWGFSSSPCTPRRRHRPAAPLACRRGVTFLVTPAAATSVSSATTPAVVCAFSDWLRAPTRLGRTRRGARCRAASVRGRGPGVSSGRSSRTGSACWTFRCGPR